MKNLNSQAHPGIILTSPPSGKINLFSYKIFILYSSVIHSFKLKTFKAYSVGGKWIQFSHPDNDAVGFSLLDQVSKRAGFPLPWNFFSYEIMSKKEET